MQNEEFIQEFKEEAAGHLEIVEKGLLQYDSGEVNAEITNDIFRAVHSIKGTAGFFGLKHIVSLSHAMEHLFDQVRKQTLAVHQDMINCLLSAADFLKEMVIHAEQSDAMDISELLKQIEGLKDVPSNLPAAAIVTADQDEESGVEAGAKEHKSFKMSGAPVEDTIRVRVSLLNDLLNIASEMVLGRNQMLNTLSGYRKSIQGLNAVLQNMNRLTTEMQVKVLLTRMQPVDRIFSKFPRFIRQISKKLGKEVELEVEGADVELDKSLIELLSDPLTHLIRNAVDHGMETPAERELQGKPRKGKIRLKAYHQAGQVNIEITDDGAGIRYERIEANAIQKKLITPQQALQMGERELLALLFVPGFSTASEVTDVSGRGVGLDVVKVNIEKLGGAVDIVTKPSEGTTFRLTLPLTVSIITSLIVGSEGQKFAIPQVNLQKLIRVKPNDPHKSIEKLPGGSVLHYQGKLLPLIRLADILGICRYDEDANEQVQCILVLKSGYKNYGLIVNEIFDNEEILVKPLPRLLGGCKSYSGVTILGDGHTAMILDTEGIAQKANLRFAEEQVAEDSGAVESGLLKGETQKLLMFGCSGPEIFCMDLSLMARVEKISESQIETVGDMEFVQIRGQSLRVIRPERYLPVYRGPSAGGRLYVLVPKLVKHPIGLLIHQIHDTVETDIEFNRDDIVAKGLVGSMILKGRLGLLLNIYELYEMAAPELYAFEEEKIQEDWTVLLVEDTPFFSRLEKNYLESAGYRVILAANGKEAWRLLGEHQVDALISDIQMPVMNGIELVKRIRAMAGFANLPTIAVTSFTDDQMKEAALDAGFDFYEHKLDKERLLNTVKSALEARRAAV